MEDKLDRTDGETRVRYLRPPEFPSLSTDIRFQIQILFYFLKLSLPGPPPPPESPLKNRKRSRKEPVLPTLSDDEHLEAFMDKLSMWQLVAGLERTDMKLNTKEDERDWMQKFFEDIVEIQYVDFFPISHYL
jgi:hypothetical protein